MQICKDLSLLAPQTPYALTIGNFDGIHLGHRALLEALKERAGVKREKTAVLTFSNHPSEVLRPDCPTPLLCSPDHKVALLEREEIDLLILLPFTPSFSQQEPLNFLKELKQRLNVSHLVLGHDAVLGYQRQGDREKLPTMARDLGMEIEYVSPFSTSGIVVSSSTIRQFVKRGELDAAAELLGRPYSIFGTVGKGAGLGKVMGYPTVNLETQSLCLPPLGVYACRIFGDEAHWRGVANLGVAPSLKDRSSPLLEVHLLDVEGDFYGQSLEVQLLQYLRPERVFTGPEELQAQIGLDVQHALEVLGSVT